MIQELKKRGLGVGVVGGSDVAKQKEQLAQHFAGPLGRPRTYTYFFVTIVRF